METIFNQNRAVKLATDGNCSELLKNSFFFFYHLFIKNVLYL